MRTEYIVLIIIFSLIILILSTCYLCFRLAFYAPNGKKIHEQGEMPPGEIYKPYYAQIGEWYEQAKSYKREDVAITSYDNLTLFGKYYEHFKGAPVEIMFHGYRGSAERDLCGGLNRCYELKRNVLVVDQRAHGKSDGNVISFGIKERFDVKAWTEYAYNRFGKDVPLLITGISMGASTVLMASSLDLPESVVGVIADCGYSDVGEIIRTVIKKMHLPARLFYPFVKLGAIIFGKFNPDQTSPEKEIKKSKLPILLIHGDKDDFVPCYTSEKNLNAGSLNVSLEVFKGAGHGMSYLIDPDRYVKVLKEFEKKYKFF